MCVIYLCVKEKSFNKVKNHIRAGEQVAERSHIPKATITHSSYGLEQGMQKQLQIFCWILQNVVHLGHAKTFFQT